MYSHKYSSGGTEENEEKPVSRHPDSESNPGLSTKQAEVLIRLYDSPRSSAEVPSFQFTLLKDKLYMVIHSEETLN